MREDTTIEMTRREYDALAEEVERRKSMRGDMTEAIATARAHGDLSENAEYHAAKEEQGQNEAQIRKIEQQLENARIVEVQDDGVVAPGKLVTFRYSGEDPETYLFGQRSAGSQGFDVLTPESPLGVAIAGRSAGDNVVARVRDRDVPIEILEVRAP